jgi:hypothetical protein
MSISLAVFAVLTHSSLSEKSTALPRGWTSHVKSAVLHAVALAQSAVLAACGKVASDASIVTRLLAENRRLREQMRIKDARMQRIEPRNRPHYPPRERLAILEMRAACGWSLERTAREFQLTATTIADWTRRVDEQGSDALLQPPEPVNKGAACVGGSFVGIATELVFAEFWSRTRRSHRSAGSATPTVLRRRSR